MLWHEASSTGISVRNNGDSDATAEDIFNNAKDYPERGLKLIKREYVKVGNRLAVRENFEVTKAEHQLRLVQTVVLRDRHTFILADLSETLGFDELTTLNEGIVASARFPNAVTQRRHSALTTNMPTGGDGLKIPDRSAAPTPEQAKEDWKAVDAAWHVQNGKAVELLPGMNGAGSRSDGITVLESSQRIETTDHFKPPVTFQITALTNVNDLRLAYPADQIIFNWEMAPTELRIDGGPASGKHLPGAGRLPANTWVGIEMTVTDSEMTLYVNGTKLYDIAGDFSQIDAPLGIESHTGTTSVRSVRVIQ